MFSPNNQKYNLNNTTDSISPHRKVSQIKNLNLYRNIQKPTLNNERLQTISDQLELGQVSNTNFMRRKYNRDFMFNYSINPFTSHINNKDNIQRVTVKDSDDEDFGQDEAGEKVRNIIDEIRKFKEKAKTQIRGNMSKQLKEMMKSKEEYSSIIQKQVQAPNSYSQHSPKFRTISNRQQIKQGQLLFDDQLELADISRLKQGKYYAQNCKVKNIFRLLFEPEQGRKQGNFILDSHYFCHNSMRDNSQKRKVTIYRDISRFARQLVLQIRTKQATADYLHANETNPQLHELQIHTILSISAGRTKPHDLLYLMNSFTSNTRQEETTTYLGGKQIWYKQDCRNVRSSKDENLDQKYELNRFKQLGYQSYEKKVQQELLKQLAHFKQGLSYEKYLISQNIRDKKLANSLLQKSNKKIESTIDSWSKEKDIERLIRKNKAYKNRVEELKIINLTSTLKVRNEHNLTVKSMQRTMSKSKSKSKSPINRTPIK